MMGGLKPVPSRFERQHLECDFRRTQVVCSPPSGVGGSPESRRDRDDLETFSTLWIFPWTLLLSPREHYCSLLFITIHYCRSHCVTVIIYVYVHKITILRGPFESITDVFLNAHGQIHWTINCRCHIVSKTSIFKNRSGLDTTEYSLRSCSKILCLGNNKNTRNKIYRTG